MSLLIHNARILTLVEGSIPRRGAEARNLSVIEKGFLWADGDTHSYGEGDPPPETMEPSDSPPEYDDAGYPNTHTIIDAGGRVVMPAFVDAHTHACWAGDRLDEWDMKRGGASYLDILNAGGGIMSTVRATRAASDEELRMSLYKRARAMLAAGTRWVEVKSGYGLTLDPETRMLHAISQVEECVRPLMGITPTALLGHALDPEVPDFVDRTIKETLPAVVERFGFDYNVDAYCEVGAWSVDDCRRLFEATKEECCAFRVHADQFNSLGMTPLAVEMGARSVDHLEASTEKDLKILAESDTFGVMLPVCGFQLDDRYADGRKFMDMGGALVIASNFNPGSASCYSMPFVISLAVRKLGLSIEEAITACTINPAELLNPDESDITIRCNTGGHLSPIGVGHDFIMLRHTDERMLAYEFGGDPVQLVVSDGRILKWTGDDASMTIIKP